MNLLDITDFSNPTIKIQDEIVKATWDKNKLIIKHILNNNCQAVPGVMSAACSTGDVEIVELLANAWKGQAGGAIGGHGMDSVLMNKDENMFKCIVRNHLLSEVAVTILSLNLGLH